MKWTAKDTTAFAMAAEAWSSHSLLALVPLSQLSSAQSSPLMCQFGCFLLACLDSLVFLTGDSRWVQRVNKTQPVPSAGGGRHVPPLGKQGCVVLSTTCPRGPGRRNSVSEAGEPVG